MVKDKKALVKGFFVLSIQPDFCIFSFMNQ
jgi:hypothetical protein